MTDTGLLRPAPPWSGLGQGPGDMGWLWLSEQTPPGEPASPVCPHPTLCPPLARMPRLGARASLEGGRCVVGALGGRRLCWGVVVVHHGSDAVAHSSLVAPAVRDRGWHQALGGG